jgi:hypothetical protein
MSMSTATLTLATLLIHASLPVKANVPVPTPHPIPSPDLSSAEAASELQKLARARPRILSVEPQQVEPGHISITARFRLRGSGTPGELRIDLWNHVENPIAEASFSIRGVSHMQIRQVYGAEDHRVWMSPTIEAELAQDAPKLMLVYWAVLTDPRLHTEVSGWLGTLPPDPLAGNPACGVAKWGMEALVWIAGAACCAGGFGLGCAACAVGVGTADDAIGGIDCNKECKPDCPIS